MREQIILSAIHAMARQLGDRGIVLQDGFLEFGVEIFGPEPILRAVERTWRREILSRRAQTN